MSGDSNMINNSNNIKTYDKFFQKATEHLPYPYQKKLSTKLLKINMIEAPTGSGKTEAVILSWLWHHIIYKKNIPTRLIYCLPQRVLVEQTRKRIEIWLDKLGLRDEINISIFMGGVITNKDFVQTPNKPAIIIGTQDMLISAALNHGYGQSPMLWSIYAGILNNDSIWIMDEVQLMNNALPTSLQLDGFRRKYGTFGPTHTIWMSATINKNDMLTPDSNKHIKIHTLGKVDRKHKNLQKRNNAKKTLYNSNIVLKAKYYTYNDASRIASLHKNNTVTIILVNNVKRAQSLYNKLLGQISDDITCKLIHSRFRSKEREQINQWLDTLDDMPDKNIIIVSTQVLEAGVDISSQTLITEPAPYASLIQRFGRCNRMGEHKSANIYYITFDNSSEDNDIMYYPYEKQKVLNAMEFLHKYTKKSLSPNDLPKFKELTVFDYVLRKKDLYYLSDTVHDLSGNNIDISRFVRTSDNKLDIDVFWRDYSQVITDENLYPRKEELCSVPITQLYDFLEGKTFRVLNYHNKEWEDNDLRNSIFPGQVIMLNCNDGGYSEMLGWSQRIHTQVPIIEPDTKKPTFKSKGLSNPVTLVDHTKHVVSQAKSTLRQLSFINPELKRAIIQGAKYHDVGKAHHIFQKTMHEGMIKQVKKTEVFAKNQITKKHSRPGFRHEMLSALYYLETHKSGKYRDLIAYMIGSHHGIVRFAIRNTLWKLGNKYILGLDPEHESLLSVKSDIINISNKTVLRLSKYNGMDDSDTRSWVDSTLSLYEKHGMFKIFYLEALIRGIDSLASKKEMEGVYKI